jgi:hypothetical protein
MLAGVVIGAVVSMDAQAPKRPSPPCVHAWIVWKTNRVQYEDDYKWDIPIRSYANKAECDRDVREWDAYLVDRSNKAAAREEKVPGSYPPPPEYALGCFPDTFYPTGRK